MTAQATLRIGTIRSSRAACSSSTTTARCATRCGARSASPATRSTRPPDGEEGLSRIAAQPPDAVVLDIGMPGVDGLEACRRLRAAGDRVPVLMLTARDAVEDRIDGLDAGADDYLVKPFDIGELKARLRALLRRAGAGDADADAGPPAFHELRLDPDAPRLVVGDRSTS